PISGLPFLEPEGARPTNLPVSIIYGQESFLLTRGGHCDCKVNFVYFRKVPGKPLVVRLTTQAKETLVDIGAARPKEFVAGYSQPVGKGRVIYLGTNPSPDILRMVLKEEGLSPYVFCQRPLVTTDLHRHRKGHLVLFVINRNEQAVTVECCLNLKRLEIREKQRFSVVPVGSAEKAFRVTGKELASLRLSVDAQDLGIWLLNPVKS
ncbi:MAG TPA: hypothetical protein PKX93_07720, partial [bacterium]|nr:hypothetical protein [bacterium]